MRLGIGFRALPALAFAVCWPLALALLGATEAALFLAPALLIAVPLVCGVYVGEELVVRLAERGPKLRGRPSPVPAANPPAQRLWPPRGTSVVAFSLAERPPPGALLPQN